MYIYIYTCLFVLNPTSKKSQFQFPFLSEFPSLLQKPSKLEEISGSTSPISLYGSWAARVHRFGIGKKTSAGRLGKKLKKICPDSWIFP